MRLFTTQVGGTRIVLPTSQIRRVLGLPGPDGVQRMPLSEALGIGAQGVETSEDVADERILLCGAPGASPMAFSLREALVETELGPTALVSLPRALRRFGSPAWLAGFARVDGGLGLVVDLDRLTHRILLSAPARAEAS